MRAVNPWASEDPEVAAARNEGRCVVNWRCRSIEGRN